MKIIIVITTCFLLMGCPYVGVISSNDPDVKLSYAEDMIDARRAIPAEELIKEAIEIYKERGDKVGLAKAYRYYGGFYKSEAFERYKAFYRERGRDVDSHLDESLTYYQKSVDLYKETQTYDGACSSYFYMAWVSIKKGNESQACEYFVKSLEFHKLHMKAHPDSVTILPKGFSSWEELIEYDLKEFNCYDQPNQSQEF